MTSIALTDVLDRAALLSRLFEGMGGVLGVAVPGEESDVVVGAAGVDAVMILNGEHERR